MKQFYSLVMLLSLHFEYLLIKLILLDIQQPNLFVGRKNQVLEEDLMAI
jgi:hypothetical protein